MYVQDCGDQVGIVDFGVTVTLEGQRHAYEYGELDTRGDRVHVVEFDYWDFSASSYPGLGPGVGRGHDRTRGP